MLLTNQKKQTNLHPPPQPASSRSKKKYGPAKPASKGESEGTEAAAAVAASAPPSSRARAEMGSVEVLDFSGLEVEPIVDGKEVFNQQKKRRR
jgi:hypothetical protein